MAARFFFFSVEMSPPSSQVASVIYATSTSCMLPSYIKKYLSFFLLVPIQLRCYLEQIPTGAGGLSLVLYPVTRGSVPAFGLFLPASTNVSFCLP
ncbi:hypothetical protein AVEN_29791-1 [Araneus ventricosus]|uniref:Uncharacterized protein n=1 Tax=Araneus ventricosus TaxID=182803 RepID=A0A4Y2VGK5_ARAVE|nr:hypothetical protein AVEN_29791-1 [Araneus ventricosus]